MISGQKMHYITKKSKNLFADPLLLHIMAPRTTKELFKAERLEASTSWKVNQVQMSDFFPKVELLFAKLPLISQKELEKILVPRCIKKYCQSQGIKYVLAGPNGQKIARDGFTRIINGRGAQIPETVSEFMKTDLEDPETSSKGKEQSVFWCRPLRDFLDVQVALFNHFTASDDLCCYDFIQKENAPKGHGAPAHFDQIIDQFFDKLLAKQPSTVSTAVNTLQKIETAQKINQVKRRCYICMGKSEKITSLLEIGSFGKMEFEGIGSEEMEKHVVENLKGFFYDGGVCFGCRRLIETSKDREGLGELIREVFGGKTTVALSMNEVYGKKDKGEE